MECEICHKDIGETIVSLPIKQLDGRLNILACLKCAEESGVYCRKHEQPHLGFRDDETTACISCIKEMMAAKKNEERVIFDKILEALPIREKRRLSEWAGSVSVLTGECEARCTLRAIATRALRMRITFEEVEAEIMTGKSVKIILPEGF